MTNRGPSSAALDVASSVRGMVWPAIPTPLGSQLLAVQYQLEVSQWLSPDELLVRQAAQLGPLVLHAHATCPFYRRRLDEADLAPDRPILC
jgi:hypothetical protein